LHVLGLGTEARSILAELRGATRHEDGAMEVVEDVPGDDLEWETLPDEMKEDEAFVTAVRDIVGSQYAQPTVHLFYSYNIC
jgi:hypothetical protein